MANNGSQIGNNTIEIIILEKIGFKYKKNSEQGKISGASPQYFKNIMFKDVKSSGCYGTNGGVNVLKKKWGNFFNFYSLNPKLITIHVGDVTGYESYNGKKKLNKQIETQIKNQTGKEIRVFTYTSTLQNEIYEYVKEIPSRKHIKVDKIKDKLDEIMEENDLEQKKNDLIMQLLPYYIDALTEKKIKEQYEQKLEDFRKEKLKFDNGIKENINNLLNSLKEKKYLKSIEEIQFDKDIIENFKQIYNELYSNNTQ